MSQIDDLRGKMFALEAIINDRLNLIHSEHPDFEIGITSTTTISGKHRKTFCEIDAYLRK